MKWLFLIIRHLWPRNRWEIIQEVNIVDSYNANALPVGKKYVLRDQFGNMKVEKL